MSLVTASAASAAPAAGPGEIFSATWVLPVIGPPIPDGAVAVDEAGTILAVGRRADVLRRLAPRDAHETRCDGALVPGLVNAHTHLELSWLAAAVPGGDGVIAWTRRLMEKVTASPTSETATTGARFAAASAAALAARALGTAALGDVGNGILGWRAMARAHLAGLFFHELVGSRERRTGDALADAAAERASVPEAELAGPAPVVPAVPAPHAPYSVGPDLLRRIFAAAAAAGRPTTIHLAEDPDEIALLANGSGGWPDALRAMGVDPRERTPRLDPCAYLAGLGAFGALGPRGHDRAAPLLVHMVCAGPDDRRRARDAGATVVLCPRSNLHIGGRLPDVAALIDDGVALALGTDSLASTPDLSLWAEMRTLCAALPEVPARRWLEAATTGGARALGLDATLGALEVGRRPGLVCVDAGIAPGEREPERALISKADAPALRWLVPAADSARRAPTGAGAPPVDARSGPRTASLSP